MFVWNVVRTLLLGQRLAASWGLGWKSDFSHSLIERGGLFCVRQGYQHVLYYTTSRWEDRTRLVLFLAYWHVRITQALCMCCAPVSCEIGASFSAHFVEGWLDCIMHIHLLMVGHLYSKTFPQKCLIAADHDVGHHLWCKQTCSLGATSRSYFDKIRSGLRIWKDYDDCNTTTSLWEKTIYHLKRSKWEGVVEEVFTWMRVWRGCWAASYYHSGFLALAERTVWGAQFQTMLCPRSYLSSSAIDICLRLSLAPAD